MKRVISLVLVAVFIFAVGAGCQQSTAAGKSLTTGKDSDAKEEEKPISISIVSEISGKAPEKCNYFYEAQDVTQIDLSMIKNKELKKTGDGFIFNLLPETGNGSIVAADGYATVKISSTKLNLGERVPDYEVYRNSFKLNDEKVNADCSSENITIKFADIEKSSNYKFVKEGDPGIMLVEFTVTGSRSIFEKEYEPEKYGESLLR